LQKFEFLRIFLKNIFNGFLIEKFQTFSNYFPTNNPTASQSKNPTNLFLVHIKSCYRHNVKQDPQISIFTKPPKSPHRATKQTENFHNFLSTRQKFQFKHNLNLPLNLNIKGEKKYLNFFLCSKFYNKSTKQIKIFCKLLRDIFSWSETHCKFLYAKKVDCIRAWINFAFDMQK